MLITNPDMLHASILPCHGQFRRILSGLAHVIVDEAHTYCGAFGCHAALVLRRLRRLRADVYGRHPGFVFCTATLANPREHVMELAGVDKVELVDQDASPRGVKHFVLWNSSSASKSPVTEVSRLLAEMVQHGLRCIAFCKTRKLCEQVLAAAREVLEEAVPAEPELASSVCVYRGGYMASDRRKIDLMASSPTSSTSSDTGSRQEGRCGGRAGALGACQCSSRRGPSPRSACTRSSRGCM